jgi:hypothetical protein
MYKIPGGSICVLGHWYMCAVVVVVVLRTAYRRVRVRVMAYSRVNGLGAGLAGFKVQLRLRQSICPGRRPGNIISTEAI